MKTLFFCALLALSAGAGAQSTTSNATSSQGNNQAITFTSPANTTSAITSTSTQNIVNSGTSQNIVDYQGDYTIRNVPSVNGPNLTTSNDTCMGSTSGSVNGPGIGIGFGTTWTDEHCKRLKMSRELWNKGMKAASIAMDCMDPSAMAALEMTGTKCPQSMTPEERVAAFGPQTLASSPRQVAQKAVAPSPPAPVAQAPAQQAAEPFPASSAVAVLPVAAPAAIVAATLSPVGPDGSAGISDTSSLTPAGAAAAAQVLVPQ